jgi:hypothetical protein
MRVCSSHVAAVLCAACLLPSVAVSPASAQANDSTPAAVARASLPPALRERIDRFADSARVRGLPPDPLYEKAAEGVLKGAPPERIVGAVVRLSAELGEALTVLGHDANAAELVAGASAIHAGVEPARLSEVAEAARGRPRGSSLVLPLVVLADMLQRQVTPAVALGSLTTLLRGGAGDAAFMSLRAAVESEIARGQAPDLATRAQTDAVARQLRPVRQPPATDERP